MLHPACAKARHVRSKINDSRLQIMIRIAICCVLHGYESQEIRCWKLFFYIA